MPQRFLRPGIRTSPRWNAVSHRAARLYIAILTLVDDYGRYDGRPSVLWADAFAVWNDQNPQFAVNPQETAADCKQLAAKRLLEFYEVDGRTYLQVVQWQETPRNKSKWPEPVSSERLPMAADSCQNLPPSSSPSSSPSPSPLVGVIEEIYQAYPRKVGKPVALKSISKALEKVAPERLLQLTKDFAAARNGDIDFCPHPSTWFYQERYNDDPKTWKPHEAHSGNNKLSPSQIRNSTITGADHAGSDAAATVARRASERAAKAAASTVATQVAGHGSPPS